MNIKQSSLCLCLDWLQLHMQVHVELLVRLRGPQSLAHCISRHLSRKISDELVSNPIWPWQTDELIPVSEVNFINILHTAFMSVVPKSIIRLTTTLSLLRFWAPRACKSCL